MLRCTSNTPLTSNHKANTLDALYTAEQTPLARFKHVWTSGLPKLDRYTTVGVLEDDERELVVHDLDRGIGMPGPVNTWLMQALAAHAVKCGQGPQLISAPNTDGVTLNFVGAKCDLIQRWARPTMNLLLPSFTIGLICAGSMLLICIDAMKLGNSGWFWAAAGFICLGIFAGQPLSAHMRRDDVNLAFYRKLRELRVR